MKRTVHFDAKWIGAAAAMLGAGMMLFGLMRGDAAEVLSKAVRICLECIGIG